MHHSRSGVPQPAADDRRRQRRDTATAFLLIAAAWLRGLLAGPNDRAGRPETVGGVAIYPLWETDEAEWRTFDDLWLRQPRLGASAIKPPPE